MTAASSQKIFGTVMKKGKDFLPSDRPLPPGPAAEWANNYAPARDATFIDCINPTVVVVGTSAVIIRALFPALCVMLAKG